MDEVTVTLQWTNESSYNITVSPYLPFKSSGSTSVQLRVPYNTLYNVSALSIDPCGQDSSFEVYYGELNLSYYYVLILLNFYCITYS